MSNKPIDFKPTQNTMKEIAKSSSFASVINTLLLSTTIITNGLISTNVSSVQAQSEPGNFSCGKSFNEKLNKSVPTTLFWTSTGRKAMIQWVKPMGKNSEWTPQKRCEAFSQRIQPAYNENPEELLFTHGNLNGQNVICTTDKVNGECKYMLITLRPKDNPNIFLKELQDTMYGEAIGPVNHANPRLTVRFDMRRFLKTAAK